MLDRLNFKFLSIFLLILTSINFIFFTYRFFKRENGYILGDWLINYHGGFTRRGLFGDIIIYLNNIIKLDLINLFFISVIILYLFFIILFINILLKAKINFFVLLLIFSPATILFNFFDPLAIGRKEFLFFLFFIIYFLFKDKKLFFYISPILSFFIVLSHELFVLLLPLFFISKFINSKTLKLKDYKLESLISFSSLVALFLILLYSDPNVVDTCKPIMEYGYGWQICLAINDLTLSYNLSFIRSPIYIIYYSFFLGLVILPILMSLLKNFRYSYKKSFILIFLSFLPISLLFFVANDWGRYIHIYSFMWLLIILFNNQEEENINLNIKKLIILIIFSTSWYMPHCCPEVHFSKYKYKSSIFYIYERVMLKLQN